MIYVTDLLGGAVLIVPQSTNIRMAEELQRLMLIYAGTQPLITLKFGILLKAKKTHSTAKLPLITEISFKKN